MDNFQDKFIYVVLNNRIKIDLNTFDLKLLVHECRRMRREGIVAYIKLDREQEEQVMAADVLRPDFNIVKTAYAILWSEHEAGKDPVPDHYTIHRSAAEALDYIEKNHLDIEINASLYYRPGTISPVELRSYETYKRIQRGNVIVVNMGEVKDVMA